MYTVAVVAYFKLLSQDLFGGYEDSWENRLSE